ncbi:hypothetical protein BG005_001582 [Podila minutissima]|nr:hypothetical protein BG005_001582 [Podila minutissima]
MKTSPITLLAVMLAMASAASAYLKHLYCTDKGGAYPCNNGRNDRCTLACCNSAGGQMYINVCTITSEEMHRKWRNEINILGFPYTSCSAQLGDES